ncbi:hypothetical protein GCM10027289_20130 [Tsukamurella serpentis]
MADLTARDLGLLALRAGIGGTLAYHGAQKLFGWFGGGGLDGTAAFFDSIGFTPGKPNAALAGAAEFGGGLGLALGAATPLSAAGAVGAMIGAVDTHADKGFAATGGGYEYPLNLGVAAAALALIGPGALSVDAALGDRVNRPWISALSLAGAAAGGAVAVARRKAASAQSA